MDVFAHFTTRVADALNALYPELNPELLARFVVEPPRDPGHGDLSTNAAMVVAKPLGKNPREVATALAEHFRSDTQIASVEVAGPGFINFRLARPVWHEVLRAIADRYLQLNNHLDISNIVSHCLTHKSTNNNCPHRKWPLKNQFS